MNYSGRGDSPIGPPPVLPLTNAPALEEPTTEPLSSEPELGAASGKSGPAPPPPFPDFLSQGYPCSNARSNGSEVPGRAIFAAAARNQRRAKLLGEFPTSLSPHRIGEARAEPGADPISSIERSSSEEPTRQVAASGG
ncbi:hypothetical protein KM043_003909 [Ampulex compressa]|nr:hypothetical protein KM043_003909 [Ampulex compressa]